MSRCRSALRSLRCSLIAVRELWESKTAATHYSSRCTFKCGEHFCLCLRFCHSRKQHIWQGELKAFPLSSACYNLTTCVGSCLVPSAAHSFEKINILTEGIRFKSHQSDASEILSRHFFHFFTFFFFSCVCVCVQTTAHPEPAS